MRNPFLAALGVIIVAELTLIALYTTGIVVW